MTRTWSAVLARLGVPTGDRRIIAPGALTNRALPLPLMWQRVSDNGHSGSVTVGAIETLVIDNESGMVTATGRFLDVRGAAEAQAQTEAGVTGPSVDIFDDVDIVEVQRLIEAGVVGPNLMDDMDSLEYAVADDGMIVITQGRIAGATLVQIPAFADVSISMTDPEPAEGEIYTDRPDMDDNGTGPKWLEGYGLRASAAETLPPSDWFRKPDLDRLTPVTVSDTGRVFGHIAGWETCHVGLPGCVTAPSSPSGYSYFHVAEQRTADGLSLPVGTLVAGPRHADAQQAFQAAQQHYDDPAARVARVVAGEDEYGIWAAGWMLPGATEEARATFMSSPVSGDWRRVGGALELIAVCSVNAPGFPVPRARVAFALESGGQTALIASSGIVPVAGGEPEVKHTSPGTGLSTSRAGRGPRREEHTMAPCGSCGGRKRVSQEFEVTFRDGSTSRFATAGEARIAAAKDASVGRPSPTVRAVAKK